MLDSVFNEDSFPTVFAVNMKFRTFLLVNVLLQLKQLETSLLSTFATCSTLKWTSQLYFGAFLGDMLDVFLVSSLLVWVLV